LLRLLIRRLSLGLPTAFQSIPGRALLFHSQGVYELEQLTDVGPYSELGAGTSDPHGSIWVLIDSNTSLIQPGGVFTERSPFFVVEATSPRINRLEWMKKVAPEVFYMKPWTWAEVAQAYVDFPWDTVTLIVTFLSAGRL